MATHDCHRRRLGSTFRNSFCRGAEHPGEASPRPTQVTGEQAAFSGSPLSSLWLPCWGPQNECSESPPDLQQHHHLWLGSGSHEEAAWRSAWQSLTGPSPGWPPPATGLQKALSSLEPLPSRSVPFLLTRQASASRCSWVLLYQNSKTPKRENPALYYPGPMQASLTPCNGCALNQAENKLQEDRKSVV